MQYYQQIPPVGLSTTSSRANNNNRERKVKSTPAKSKRESTGFPVLKRENIPPSRTVAECTIAPLKVSGDRFIPHRGSMKSDIAHYKLLFSYSKNPSGQSLLPSPALPPPPPTPTPLPNNSESESYKSDVSFSLFGDDIENSKILQLKSKPMPSMSIMKELDQVGFGRGMGAEKESETRAYISSSAERILDAPNLKDDFYLSLLDWSSTDLIALALDGALYTWNPINMEANLLVDFAPTKYISSVSWSTIAPQYIALGTSTCEIQIWDAEKKLPVRSLTGHTARVGCLSWNQNILSSGSLDGTICNFDLRAPSPIISHFSNHNGEVCGLKWSPDGSKLASGGNDNVLNVWQLQTPNAPLFTRQDHQACVRALAWCPWRIDLLASGGGSADRTIKFWNTATGNCIHSVDSESQVSSLTWSKHTKEIISAHGFSKYSLVVWKYPSMNQVAELLGHEQRVLHVSLSPDGSTLVSASADETLRFWRICDGSLMKGNNSNNPNTNNVTLTRIR